MGKVCKDSEVASWQVGKGGRLVRWEGGENGRVPGFIQGWGT